MRQNAYLWSIGLKGLDDTVRTGEKAGKSAFSSFPAMFYTLPKGNFTFQVIFYLSSPNVTSHLKRDLIGTPR